MKINEALGVMLAVSIMVTAAACHGGTPAVRSVSLSHYFTGSLSSGVAEMAAAFNNEKSGIELIPTPLEHETFKTAIRLQLEGPNPPDLFSYWAGDKTGSLVRSGLVRPLEPNTALPANQFSASVRKALSYDGKLWMLPLTRHYVGFFYNKKLFLEYGLKPPATWDELRRLAGVLAGHRIPPFALGGTSRWPLQFWFDYLLLRQSGYQYRESLMAGRASWRDPQVAAAFRNWESLLDQQWFNADWANIDWDAAARMVVSGKAGMTLMGTWAIGLYNEMKANYPADYDFFVFPIIDGTVDNSALGPIDGLMMSAKPRSAADAQAVLARMADAAVQSAFNVAAGGIAPNQMVPETAYPPLQRHIKTLVESATDWAFNFDLACPAAVSEAGLDGFVAFAKDPAKLPAILDGLEKARLAENAAR